MVASLLLVAVMVTDPADAGAVNRPLALMVPLLADQLTVGLVPFCAEALHCEVAPGAIDAGLQDTATPEFVTEEDLLPPPPPQPV